LSKKVINTKIDVYELCKNGKNLLESFINDIQDDENLFDKLAGALSIVEIASNLKRLPQTRWRQLHVAKQIKCKVYEAKNGAIRIYLFHEEKVGRVIITGGKKGDQPEDIKLIEKIIKDYFDERR
jgi:hypothetical protein